MKISIIVAHGKKRQIGNIGIIPWKSKEDLRYFKEKTMGHFIVMGRVTYEGLNNTLHGRKKIVLSKKLKSIADGLVARTASEAIKIAKINGEDELFICGGEDIYKVFLPLANKLYLTKINFTGPSDKYFPEIDESKWNVVFSEKFIDGNFCILEKELL